MNDLQYEEELRALIKQFESACDFESALFYSREQVFFILQDNALDFTALYR